ncbi:MAG: mechanosensitive ion channel family protein [Chloroflexales bacterium]|nr:mechanosensitive ion channel family protein [Chloroflexales bacterium]
MVEAAERSFDFTQFIIPTLIIAGTILVGWIIEWIVFGWFHRLARRTSWRGDDLLVQTLRWKILFWLLLLGVYLALPSIPLELNSGTVSLFNRVLFTLFIISATITIAQIATGLINISSNTDTRPALSIVNNIVRVAIYISGFLIVLGYFGQSITPALAALGVTGLAVSLALQATLTDLISGLQIILTRPIRPGDYVKLSTGEEGYVTDINWRITRIQQLANNMVIVPNSTITSSILVNYFEPQRELSVLINIGVSYDCDLEHVERVTVEVAKEIMQSVPGGIPDNDPFIRYNTFSDFSINFTVILRGKEFVDQYLLKHEFIKRLHQRYRQEGIEIPFPIRTLEFKDSDSKQSISATLQPDQRPAQ